MGSDAKNLMSDGNVQIVKTGEVIGATQLTEGEFADWHLLSQRVYPR